MLELPEAVVLAKQINISLKGKRIEKVYTNSSPHKQAWFFGDPRDYHGLLAGKTIENALQHGGLVEIWAGDARLLFCDGVNLRYCPAGEKVPVKHQLHLEFDDSSSLIGYVQMYGGLWAFPAGRFDSAHFMIAMEKPSPLTEQFNRRYFDSLLADKKARSLPAKAFLATEQRIPGLGNGVLQDILWHARIHPKRKMALLEDRELEAVFNAVKAVLAKMAADGGRDTERDLYGCPGGYTTTLSKKTVNKPCPACGTTIKKEPYMGGSIYFCHECQKL
jgi:formamidopyrimidine-DNA glycosylase